MKEFFTMQNKNEHELFKINRDLVNQVAETKWPLVSKDKICNHSYLRGLKIICQIKPILTENH